MMTQLDFSPPASTRAAAKAPPAKAAPVLNFSPNASTVPVSGEAPAQGSWLQNLLGGMFNPKLVNEALNNAVPMVPVGDVLHASEGIGNPAAAVTSFADSATLGALPYAMSGADAAINALGGDAQGTTFQSRADAYRAELDKRKQGGGALGAVGDIGGYLVPMGVEKAMVNAVTRMSPEAAKLAASFMGHAGGRIVTSAVEGGVHMGAQSALSGRDSAGLDALLGLVGGGVGHTLLGELAPKIYRSLAGSDAGQKISSMLLETIKQGTPSKFGPADLLAQAKAAGPAGMLADAPALQGAATDLATNSSAPAMAAPLRDPLFGRLGQLPDQPAGTDLVSHFETQAKASVDPIWMKQQVYDPLPADGYSVVGNRSDAARSVGRMNTEMATTRKQLQPQYDAVLKADSTVSATTKGLKKLVIDTLADPATQPSPAMVGIANDVISSITAQVKNAKGPLNAIGVRNLVSSLRQGQFGPSIGDALSVLDPAARRVQGLLSILADKVESQHLDSLPGYGDLNVTYRASLGAEKAHGLGNLVFTATPDKLSTVMEEVAKLPPELHPAFLEGTVNALTNKLDVGATTALEKGAVPKVVSAITNNPTVVNALKQTFGVDTNALLTAAEQTKQQMATAKPMAGATGSLDKAASAVASGRKTAFNKFIVSSFMTNLLFTGALGATIGSAFGPLGGVVGGAVGAAVPSTIGTMSATRSLMEAASMSPRAVGAMANALSATGDALAPVIDQIYKGNLPVPARTGAGAGMMTTLDKATAPINSASPGWLRQPGLVSNPSLGLLSQVLTQQTNQGPQ